MSPFDLSDYEPVEDRIRAFRTEHFNGDIVTEILSTEAQHDAGMFIVKASVYRGDDLRDDRPAATGLAAELATKTGVNSTSPLENCETSAIGRALANFDYSSKKSARASREEMEKVARVQMSSAAVVPSGSAAALDPTSGVGEASPDEPSGDGAELGEVSPSPDTTSPADDKAAPCDHDLQDTFTDPNTGTTTPIHKDYLYCPKCRRTFKRSELERQGVAL